jgi:lysophospholipase L1-like esterase
VRFLGRVDARDPEAARFSWAGSGFAAVVEGTTISVRLTSQSSSVFYMPVIDGEPGERFEVKTGDQTVTLASGLSAAAHALEVYRDTEADGPISVFRGFEAGKLLGAPRASGRFIEIIGDSISAGYGSLGSERHGSNAGPGCGANAGNSSWFATYSSVAARALDAEVSTLARSGFGMVRGYGQNTNVMPPLFDDTLAGSNSPAWKFEHQPQAVIVNLGTNDWNGGDPGTSYETAYIKFVTEVRMRYPDAWILLTVGSSLEPDGAKQCGTRLGNIVEARMQAGDEKIDSFDIGLQDSSMTGCGWHPSAAEHKRMGMVLVEELKGRLGW